MWIQSRDRRTGRQLAVLVPSASTPNKYHLVTRGACDCRGFAYRQRCKHHAAVQAEITVRAESVTSAPPAPVSGPETFYTASSAGGTIRPNGTERARLSALAGDIWGTDGEGS